MVTSNALSADVQAELIRRHKSTATTVLSLLPAVISERSGVCESKVSGAAQ